MSSRTRWFILGGLVVTLALAFGASRYASPKPDGLERVAVDKGLDSNETTHALAASPLADYETRGMSDAGLRTGIAGVIGVVIVFGIAGGTVWVAGHRRRVGRAATVPSE